jgi:lipid A 3-O-deacylase
MIFVATVLVALATLAAAQTESQSSSSAATVSKDSKKRTEKHEATTPVDTPLHNGSNEFGAFVGGGNGFGKRSGTHMVYAGGRWGKVLTDDILSGWMRGNFEFQLEVLPIYKVFQEGDDATGAAFTPAILKWNFLHHGKVKPFATIGGGLLITNHDVPLNTNNLNFTPQGGFGVHYLTTPNRAITGEIRYLHVSNASLANQNSGINASIQFTIGYTWFK